MEIRFLLESRAHFPAEKSYCVFVVSGRGGGVVVVVNLLFPKLSLLSDTDRLTENTAAVSFLLAYP